MLCHGNESAAIQYVRIKGVSIGQPVIINLFAEADNFFHRMDVLEISMAYNTGDEAGHLGDPVLYLLEEMEIRLLDICDVCSVFLGRRGEWTSKCGHER